jgi:hypothetical protein
MFFYNKHMKLEFNGHIIKAITIKQPYASLIINRIKDIENRTWNKKIYQNVCKNWLFVHASSKLLPKKELITLIKTYKDLEITNLPTSCIIGMMHIKCVGNITDSVHKTMWASGPKCWYIDAIIKFKQPVLSVGKLGQWDPEEKIHTLLQEQINESMYNIMTVDNIDFVKKDNIYYAAHIGKYMTWEAVIDSLINKSNTFTYKLIQFLLNVEYKAYFWECDKVNMKKPFRFAIFNSKTLSERKQDDNAFKGSINCNKNVISFPSLTKNVDLVVPCKRSHSTEYTSLATFSRSAPIKQQVAFWKKVAQNIKNGDWVSTSGLGVSWLHVRITSRPKYYHDAFDKNPIKNTRKSMEEFIDNFKFPKKFVNLIVVGKQWKGVQEQDMITNYLELLPKYTKVFCVDENTKNKVDRIKFNESTIIYKTDWKKYGRFGKRERNMIIFKEHIYLVTIFGNQEDDLVEQANMKGIKVIRFF